MAAAIAAAWAQMQQEVGDSDGPLAIPADMAGEGQEKMQKALTRQRELAKFQHLDVDIRALQADDMRKRAWTNLDKFSTVWVTAWPDRDAYMSNAEFAEVASFYFGMPSPACRAFVGQRIGTSRVTVDAYGCKLTTVVLPGDGWRTQHDALKWRLTQDMKLAQVRSTTEVFGLFAPYLPQGGRAQLNATTARQRQGLVPDFLLYASRNGHEEAGLLELKTLHFGSSTYPAVEQRCEAVARRARGLHSEYLAKARNLDARFNGVVQGQDGPVTRKLLAYGEVRGIVFGAWGEASAHTHQLLGILAHAGARAR